MNSRREDDVRGEQGKWEKGEIIQSELVTRVYKREVEGEREAHTLRYFLT